MKKEGKTVVHSSLDIGQIVSNIETQLSKGFEGTIVKVESMSSNIFFKDTSGKYEDREGIAVTVKVEGDGTEFSQFYSIPNIRGWEQSNLYAYKKKYNSVPIVGQKVNIHIDESGFFRVVV